MVVVRFRYPDDPVAEATLMFGAEFFVYVRNGQQGVIVAVGERFEIDEIVCDACNLEIGVVDPCCYVEDHARVYCWSCASTYILRYRVET